MNKTKLRNNYAIKPIALGLAGLLSFTTLGNEYPVKAYDSYNIVQPNITLGNLEDTIQQDNTLIASRMQKPLERSTELDAFDYDAKRFLIESNLIDTIPGGFDPTDPKYNRNHLLTKDSDSQKKYLNEFRLEDAIFDFKGKLSPLSLEEKKEFSSAGFIPTIAGGYIADFNPRTRRYTDIDAVYNQQLIVSKSSSEVQADRFVYGPARLANLIGREAGQGGNASTLKNFFTAYDPLIEQIASQYKNVEANDIRAIIKIESMGEPFAVSPTGALGVGQLTSWVYGEYITFDGEVKSPVNPFKPEEALTRVADLLSDLKRTFSSEFAIIAYHDGATKVRDFLNNAKAENIYTQHKQLQLASKEGLATGYVKKFNSAKSTISQSYQ